MLETDTARIRKVKSMKDMDKISTLFYASYVKPDPAYGKKIKEYIFAWARTYQPTGNTINENKFVPLLWGYHQFSSEFTAKESQSKLVVVDTSAENIPAINLYKNSGFKEKQQWNAHNGIKLKRFEIKTN